MKRIILFGFLVLVFSSCKTTKLTKQLTSKTEVDFFKNQFTGVLVVDANTKDTVISVNANRYFTPASNTKIITLYTALQLLPNKLPAFKYSIDKDTISILGTGDPTFLHPFFKDSTALQFVNKFKKIKVITGNIKDNIFAPGWAWEDFDTYFSPEKSAFPMYGNVLEVSNVQGNLQCNPSVLRTDLSYSTTEKFSRKLRKNTFFYKPKSQKIKEIPMIMDSLLVHKLWNDLLPNKVSFSKKIPKNTKTFYSISSDSLYKRMMYKSDNFLAEQMLLMASSTMSDTLNSKRVREYILQNQLKNLKHQPRWVDGSGLSRYNLYTPTIFVEVLTKLYDDIPTKRLFDFFPIGREEISSWYLGNPQQYLFAKSGYVSNNYNLSGYLVTDSGKILIFSFMNNHYRKPTSELKKQIQDFLTYLRDVY